MAYTRANLLTDANAFLHRTDLPVDVPTDVNFIDKANQRIGRDFRVSENALTAALTTPYALPADFQEAIRIQATGPAGLYPLARLSGDTESAINWPAAFPDGYWIRGSQLNVAPTLTQPLVLEYFSAPALAATGSSTNPLLTNYPEAYLYYVLMLANIYIQNSEQVAMFSGLYADLKMKANAVYQARQQPVGRVLPNSLNACVAT
jgi:hypothetical protein